MRKDFILPEQDESFLNVQKWEWESISSSNLQWVLIHHYPLPDGYNYREVTVGIMIPPGYPVAPLDMVYFYPDLKLVNGKPIAALTLQGIDSKPFQRWSRHRTTENPWRPGIDDISAHIFLINFWLERELTK